MARNWGALSPIYRARLERKGISREQYESGVRLSAARGHGKTPERPSRVERNPEAYGYTYPEYVRARAAQFPNAVRTANRRVAYDHAKVLFAPAIMDELITRLDLHAVWKMTGRVSDATLREMTTMSLSEWQDKASVQARRRVTEPPERDWFVAVDGYWYNPFWYH